MKRSFKICRIIIPGIVGGIFLFLYFLSVKQISEFENSLIEKKELIEKISHRILPEDVLSWQIMGDEGKIKFARLTGFFPGERFLIKEPSKNL